MNLFTVLALLSRSVCCFSIISDSNAMLSTIVSLVAILGLTINSVRADCYSHDGIPALSSRYYNGPELVPCSDSNNACCLEHQKCGTNLLCSRGDALTREYCSNKEWKGCSTIAAEKVSFGITLIECGNNIVCYDNDSCCVNGDARYYVDPATGAVQNASIAKGMSIAEPRWWDWNATLASSPPQGAPVSSISSQSTSPTASAPGTTTDPPSSQTSTKSTLSAGASAGIGIGAAILVAAIAALAWFLLRRRKRNQTSRDYKLEHEVAANPPQYHDAAKGAAPQSDVYHLHGDSAVAELDSGGVRRELQ